VRSYFTSELVVCTGIPKTTTERALEDLVLVGLVDASRDGDHATAAKLWSLAGDAAGAWPGASPETSGGEASPDAPRFLEEPSAVRREHLAVETRVTRTATKTRRVGKVPVLAPLWDVVRGPT